MKNLLLILITAISIICCTSSNGKLPKVGEYTSVKQQCLSATSERAYDELNKVSNRRDEAALSYMIERGEVFVINTFDKGKMVKHSFGKCLVDIEGKGKVWIASDFIKTK